MTLTLDRPAPRSPEVVDALTRRGFIAGAGALLVASSCGGEGPDAASAPPEPPATRNIVHAAGTTEVPIDPKRIVTLQDQNALLPLLELGVKPVASAGQINDDGTTTYRRTEGFDTAGIESVGTSGEPNLEAIAAARPDLIVCDEFGAQDVYDELSRIAPTVFVQVFDRPLTEALLDFAEVVGRRARAEELQRAYDARIQAFRQRLGADLERTSVALLAASVAGKFGPAGTRGQAQYTVMLDLELTRPPAQQADEFSPGGYSLEQLPEHDADAIIVNGFGGKESSPGLDALVDSSLYTNLAATQAGQSYVIDATRSVGSAWARMGAFLDELERILLDPAFDHDVVDEVS